MIIEAAKWYRQRGWGIVFIRPGEKRPMRRGWTLKTEEPEDFEEGSQLSVLPGALSGNRVCVDLDSRQALELADAFLPKTPAIEGRPGKPRAHRWYEVINIPPELQAAPNVAGGIGGLRTRHFYGAGIDLLGTGSQVVVPPSLHPSGEQREWLDPNAEPAVVDAAELVRAVEALAGECGWRDRRDEAARYVSKIEAVEGAGGDSQTFRAASALVCGFGLDLDDARPILHEWNKTCAFPPWQPADLERKLAAAAERAGTDPRYPIGHLILDGRSFDDPVLLAQHFPGIWRCWNSRFYHYENGKYDHITHGELSARVLQHIDCEFGKQYLREMRTKKNPKRSKVTAANVRDTISALELRFLVPSKYELPCLLPTGERKDWIPLRNGILDLTTLEIMPHTPDWFSTVQLDYEFDPHAEEPNLSGWLEDWFGEDHELVALAQEWSGYCLSRCTDQHAFMMLVGDGANGKSAFAAMLQAIIGVQNCSYQSWHGLGLRFGLVATLGKLLNFADEAGEFDRAAEHVLKWFVGGQPILFEEKHVPAFTATPTARLMTACNTVPRFADRTDGIWRRLLLLQFTKKIQPKRMIRGMDKVDWWAANANLPGLLNWAIEGLKRLRAQGSFTQPCSSKAGKDELRRENNPVTIFFEEHPLSGWISAREVYSQYRFWAEGNGLVPLSAIALGREIKRAFPDARREMRRIDGRVVKGWLLPLRFDCFFPSTGWVEAVSRFMQDDWDDWDEIELTDC